jgi:serine-type D-Ala-D-Ala carboxypeptidase
LLKNEAISEFLQERINAGEFPSAVYVVAEKGEILFRDALGLAVVEPERIEATLDTIYDLASLTKPLVTGLLTAMLVEDGSLRLNDRIDDYLGGSRQWHSSVTLQQLLTHTSGLPAWRPFYHLADSPDSVPDTILATDTEAESMVIYSDLNFILLAAILERSTGVKLPELAKRKIIEPLGLEDTGFNPSKHLYGRIAASELGNEYERQTCIDQGYISATDAEVSGKFRDYQIRGEVHDGNAWFMGGASGHAGLFGTARDVFRIALQFLPEHTTLLKPETCELFRRNFTPDLNEDRSFAFQLASTADSTAGTAMPPESFGHNGFTGTSLWIDPVNDRIFVLLTNRTHAHPLPFVNINSTRRRFHDLAIEQINQFS